MLPSDTVAELPDTTRAIGYKICGLVDCAMQTGVERSGAVTELYASCTGLCREQDGNIPEQAILAVAESLVRAENPTGLNSEQ